jgi:hypothetical protein
MTNKLSNVLVAMVLGGAFAAGTLASCDDDDDNLAATGTAGTTGSAGVTGTAGRGGSGGAAGAATAGTGGGPAMMVFTMNLSGANEVPGNTSAATGAATVTLNRTTGAVSVDGTFTGLTSMVTAAHIHGPASSTATAPVVVPLTVTGTTSGTVTGTGMMNTGQMNDMIGGMTYLNIHSVNYPDGEIRAQIQ